MIDDGEYWPVASRTDAVRSAHVSKADLPLSGRVGTFYAKRQVFKATSYDRRPQSGNDGGEVLFIQPERFPHFGEPVVAIVDALER